MTSLINRWPIWAMAASVAALAGCSAHPIPDDVSRYSTEDIVRNVRCEAKDAVRRRIELALLDAGITGMDPERVLLDKRNFERIKRTKRELAELFVAFGASTIAYRFDFDITENNNNSGAVTFAVPFTTGQFSLALSGKLNKQRECHRTFTTTEKFEKLVNLDCREWAKPARNMLYPLTGSIGIGKVINTFIDVSQLEGGKDKFVDEITFTTFVSGTINPTLELTPVTNRFQVVNANATFENNRNDMHKVTVSLAYPNLKKVDAIRASSRESISELSEETKDRALINICIADGEAREDRFGVLREISPREYCRRNGTMAPW